MGEKRAYKARKPGGGRKKLKPEYDAGKNLKDQMDAAVALYEEDCSLQSIADVLNLNPIKVRKLLITAGVYKSNAAKKVKNTFEEYRDCCYQCPYAQRQHVGDITVGDYWGVQKYDPQLLMEQGGTINSKEGVSCLLINTECGQHLVEKYGA